MKYSLTPACIASHKAELAQQELTRQSVAELTSRLKAEYKLAKEAFQRGAVRAMNCGDLLNKIKDELGHGNWEPWLEGLCPINPRTVQRYMRLAKHRSEIEAKATNLADLAASAAEKLIPLSESEQLSREKTKLAKDKAKEEASCAALDVAARDAAGPIIEAKAIDRQAAAKAAAKRIADKYIDDPKTAAATATPQTIEHIPGESKDRDLARLLEAWKPFGEAWEAACNEAQNEFVDSMETQLGSLYRACSATALVKKVQHWSEDKTPFSAAIST